MKITVTEETPSGEITQTSVSFDDKKTPRNDDDECHTCKQTRPGPFAICGLKALLCLFGGLGCDRRRNM